MRAGRPAFLPDGRRLIVARVFHDPSSVSPLPAVSAMAF